MYIFGKFETFKKRLEKIIQLLNVFNMFSTLAEASIEGIEPHAARFSQIVTGLKKKQYDFLDQKNLAFDTDFLEFMQVISELQVMITSYFCVSLMLCCSTSYYAACPFQTNLQMFMDKTFDKMKNTLPAVRVLKKFQR